MGRKVLIGLLLVLGGCVPSLHPLYTDKDLIFDLGLLGEWEWKEDTGKEIWAFTKEGEKEYQLVFTDKEGKQGRFHVHLLKIDDRMFLDLFPQNSDLKESDFYKLHLVSPHTFMLVTQIQPTLQMAFFDPDWTKAYLKEHPEAIRHEKVDDQIVLTAQPKELQAFVLQHERDAFHKMGILTRKASTKKQ
jgi:hypothetical protein